MAERPSALEAAAAEAGMEMDEAAGGEIGEVEAVAAAAAVRGGWPPTATQCCNMTNSCRMAAKQPPGPINLVYRVRIRFTGSDRIWKKKGFLLKINFPPLEKYFLKKELLGMFGLLKREKGNLYNKLSLTGF